MGNGGRGGCSTEVERPGALNWEAVLLRLGKTFLTFFDQRVASWSKLQVGRGRASVCKVAFNIDRAVHR